MQNYDTARPDPTSSLVTILDSTYPLLRRILLGPCLESSLHFSTLLSTVLSLCKAGLNSVASSCQVIGCHAHFEWGLPLGLGATLLPVPIYPAMQWIVPQKACQWTVTPCLSSPKGTKGEGTLQSPGRDYGIVKVLSFGFSRCEVDRDTRIKGDKQCTTPDAPLKAP